MMDFDMSSHFDIIPECDCVTDVQT